MTSAAFNDAEAAAEREAIAAEGSTRTTPDFTVARAFLQRLDPEAAWFTFQTFDDTKKKRPYLTDIRHGEATNSVFYGLASLNALGAGVFVTINATDGKGRETHNIERCRAVFVDLDGAPLAPVLAAGLEPHIVVESSPGRWHVYWLCADCPLGEFKRVQLALARRFNGDPNVHDLPRVMRLPGFLHQKGKGEPFASRVLDGVGTTVPPYALATIVAALALELDAPENRAPDDKAQGARAVPDETLRELRSALGAIPADERDLWVSLGLALKPLGDAGRALWLEWSQTSDKFDPADAGSTWASFHPEATDYRAVFAEAQRHGWQNPKAGPKARANGQEGDATPRANATNDVITWTDFYSILPQNKYLYVPTRDLWPAESVVGHLGKDTRIRLDIERPIVQMTWHPNEPLIISDRIVSDGGWVKHRGVSVVNLYRGPNPSIGDPAQAGIWRDHLRLLYPDEAEHIERWLAHRIQRPGEKLNHALVLGGGQGIGKDTILAPVKHGVGPWNWSEITPVQMLGRFNGWAKAVVVRISEARDLGDFDRFAFYDHSKSYIAAPPDVIRVDEKNLREHPVFNLMGVIITTNHKTDGIYLPADDRRHFVAWSERTKESFTESYWSTIWDWYDEDGEAVGIGHVRAFLQTLDLSRFDPKAPPTKTSAWYAVVAAGSAPEDAELRDAIEQAAMPDALTLETIVTAARALLLHDLANELGERKARRALPHKLERAGYVPVRNPDADDGLFKLRGRRQVVYAKRTLSYAEQVKAARRIA